MTTEHTPTTRPPTRRPIRNGPGDPATRTLITTLYATGVTGLLFGTAGEHTIALAALTIAATAITASVIYRTVTR